MSGQHDPTPHLGSGRHLGALSTHCREVITDVRGEYPDFLETLHRNLALCTKAYRGWPEEVFNKRSTGVHALLTPEAMMNLGGISCLSSLGHAPRALSWANRRTDQS